MYTCLENVKWNPATSWVKYQIGSLRSPLDQWISHVPSEPQHGSWTSIGSGLLHRGGKNLVWRDQWLLWPRPFWGCVFFEDWYFSTNSCRFFLQVVDFPGYVNVRGVGLLQVTDPFQGFQGAFLLNVLAHGIRDCFVFVSYFCRWYIQSCEHKKKSIAMPITRSSQKDM